MAVKAVFARAGKAIVLTPGVTVNYCETSVAATKFVLPACEALMVQVPTDPKLIVPPLVTVQTVPVVVE